MEPNLLDAISNLCAEKHSNSGFRINGKVENLTSLDCLTIDNNVTPLFTWADVQSKKNVLLAEYTAQTYSRARAIAYPSLADQADMQYHDALNSTTTWKDAIAKVKLDFPKS